MFGGGDQVGANVVLTADNSGYDSSMQQSVAQTNRLASAYDNLKAKIDRGFQHAEHVSLGISAADIASLTAATAAAGRLQSQMQQLSAQSNVLNQTYGNGRARMAEYTRAVDSVRSSFGEATSSAAQLVQTISGFERGGSTQGLTQMAQNFERMSQTTGENASALAQSVLTLEQTMGNGLRSTRQYSDQLVSMAEASNTSAESLANFAAQIAPLGRQLNMTQSEITGFAAAFSKAGQDGYRASNVFSQMTSDIAQSLQTNSPRLAAYANLLGVTTQALKGMSGAAVTSGLFDAIGRRGSGSLQTLNELGYDGLNVTRVVSAVTQQSGGVGNYVRQANGAFGDNAASAGGQTAGQQFSKLKEDLQQSGEAIGAKFLPALQSVMTLVDKLALNVTQFMQGPGGDLVATFSALLAPVAALAGGLLSLHGAILPLMTLMALRRSSFGTGLVEGFKYGGRGPRGEEMFADPRIGNRPMVAKAYDAGQGVGMFGRMGGTGDRLSPRMRWVLGADKVAQAEGGAAQLAAEEAAVAGPGLFARGGGKVAGFLHRNVVAPQFDPLRYKNPLDRMPYFGAGGGGKSAESLATAETGAAEAATGFKARLVTMSVAAREWVASVTKGSESIVSSSEAMAKAQTDMAETTTAASVKIGESMGAAATATQEAAGAISTASATIMAAARASAAAAGGGMLGMAKGVGSGALAAGGIGMRGLGAGLGAAGGALAGMGPMGWTMMAAMAVPALMPLIHKMADVHEGSQGPGPSDIMGTGLSFPVGGVVAPVAQGGAGATFNPMRPTAAQTYSAQQAADYTNKGVANIRTAQQAAAIYGPAWGQMAAGDQRSLANDLIKRLGPGGYQQFVSSLQSGNYSTLSPANAGALAGMKGGLAAAYSLQSQIGQGYTNPAGSNFRGMMDTYLSAPRRDGRNSTFDPVHMIPILGSWLSMAGAQGQSDRSTGMGIQFKSASALGGFAPWGSHTTYGLSGTGLDFARSLFGGDPSAKAQADLGRALYRMPKGMDSQGQLSYVLNRLSEGDLSAALQNNQLQATGNRGTDIKAVLDSVNTASKTLTSALHGLGLSTTQQHELANEDASNPAYYGQKLYGGGIGQRRLSQLYLQGGSIFPGTIDAVQAYGANQLSMLSPFMTAQQQLLGSSTGARGVSGMNAGMINTDMGAFNGQFSLLGTAQGALRTGRALDATGQLSGDSKAMGNLQTASNNLEQAFTSQLQTMKQYEMTLDQMNFSSKEFRQSMAWQAEQQKLMVGREKEDQARQVGREEYSFNLQRKRAESDFQRSRHRAEDDYNLQRSRAIEDFSHQTTMMIKQSALSMHDIYSQAPSQGFTSAQFLLYNNAQQTTMMNRQEGQLSSLRKMGMSSDAIQQLGLTGANNAQELNGLFAQITQNPALIDQINSAVKQRLSAAGSLATDASSMTYQEQVHSFQLSLDRGAEDFSKSMKRAHDDFDLQMTRSATDFARQMGQQNSDFHRQLTRQQKDYNTSVSHSWTTFNDQVTQSMKQMNLAAAPLTDTARTLNSIAQKMAGSNIGDTAAALAKAYPQVMSVISSLASLLNPNQTTSGKNEPAFLKLLDIMNSKGKFFMGSGGAGSPPQVAGASGAGLPKGIAERMAADHPTSGYCLRDVEDVLGAPHHSRTAYAAWLNAKGHRYSMNTLIPPPIGAPIFFGQSYGGGDGHIAINAGGGMMWSEDAGNQWQKKRIWPGVLGWSSVLDGGTVAPNYGMQGFAKGSWDLPADMIAQIHKGEMIIPAKVAEAVRGVVSKGQVAAMGTHAAPVYNHVDARTYSTVEETTFTGDINIKDVNSPRQLAEAAKAQARLKALARR